MLFSFAVRAVYVESCSMFTRGGVYRVVKEALGGTFAKLSVSALMFDYILTGPISGVSAGQYITGLLNELMTVGSHSHWLPPAAHGRASPGVPVRHGLHLGRVRGRGDHLLTGGRTSRASRSPATKPCEVMQITTVMVVILIVWGTYSIAVNMASHLPPLPRRPHLHFSTDAWAS